MTYIIHFDIVAILLFCIAHVVFFKQKYRQGNASKTFSMLLHIALVASFLDILSSLSINYVEHVGRFAVCFITSLYYLANIALPLATAKYVWYQGGHSRPGRCLLAAFYLPWMISNLIVFSNPWTSIVFGLDAGLDYFHGPALAVLYGISILYLALSAIFLSSRKTMLSTGYRIVLYISLFLPLPAIALQHLFSGVMLVNFSSAVSLLLILFTIQNNRELVDAVSGLYNQEAFIRFVNGNFRMGGPFQILLLHIQNVQLLHHVRDVQYVMRLLRSVGVYLNWKCPSPAMCFYLESGSFIILLKQTVSLEENRRLLSEIQERFNRSWTLDDTENWLQLHSSLLLCPDDAEDVAVVLNYVEELRLKKGMDGHAGEYLADELRLVDRVRENRVEKAIAHALAQEKIRLVYQPVYSIKDKRFLYADAMMILRTEGVGKIPQSELVRVAEQNAQMHELGMLALSTLCEHIKRLQLVERGIEQVQIRLTGMQCMQSDLPQQVMGTLEAWDIPPERICFEITESAALHSPEMMSLNMRILSAQGISFALDDYGSGYTDFNYIMQLPFSIIKLDKKIIKAGFESKRGRVVLESTVELLRRLKRRIVAEGVETEEQAAVLAWLGCDYLQGYYLARPAELEAFEQFLDETTR
jgi:EAL domain-containing protein (putative c-di-GMP-specific phosphodiesterase class I)/GGDEF domain-containing protein